ncbi:epidermal growth factor-like protein 7 isoform X2 [Neopelma chrysocephalum]|uniref:epidermal growth factor-like protein 7 isoform X2 n=1 Tax=Neopelma chrysocephalum TaxID=114329 RepID=UPI000FCD0B81|nr:epidermal growth factor-like protein 7 isoform X2 [Neopelma chrysocephalum]
MCHLSCLLSGLLLILSTTSTDGFARAGRRVCAAAPQSRAGAYTESHVQPVYQPYLTTCQGHRVCSTYRTIYRVAYRQRYRQLPEPVASCCPGWSRANTHTLSCNRALCWVPCQNGGSCTFPGRCACPPGWTGRACQTDVDECASQSHGCSQLCINTAGSYRCTCQDGFTLAADDKDCRPLVPVPEMDTFSQAGPSNEVKEEMSDLRSRVEALEQCWPRQRSQQQSQLCSTLPAAPTPRLFQPSSLLNSTKAPRACPETPAGAGPFPQPHAIGAGGRRHRPHQPTVPLPPATGQN